MYFDMTYIIIVLPAIIFSLIASSKVNSTFKKYSKIRAASGMTGAEVARRILDANGLANVAIEQVSGSLTDHYDPRANVIRLSQPVYGSSSVAAIGVAAHETGHAVQYATGYSPIKLRAAIIPATNIGSKLAMPLIILGLVLSATAANLITIAYAGILCFSLSALFQLITLPVEFNASRRALNTIESFGILSGSEQDGARKVLSAAAMTYVAALAVSLAQLLRLLLMVQRRDSR